MIHPLQPQFSYPPDSSQAKVALSLFGLLVCSATTVAIGLFFKFQLFANGLGAGLIVGFLSLGFIAITAVSLRALYVASQKDQPFTPQFTIEEV